MTEIAIRQSDSLTLTAQQSYWNDQQLAVLRHMGVEQAPEGDLRVFHHVCQRTGLDPFARQIYMIGRLVSEQQPDGSWAKVQKYTIQTGIDGFRLIGRRAADRAHHKVSVTAPLWMHEDGTWRPVWRNAWGHPVAAKVVIHRDGEPFEGVALFDEYKQAKRNGDLTQMWAQRPAGQIAKCAEALAWRMAFPQDLSGIYADEEMGQADRPELEPAQTAPTAAARMKGLLGAPAEPEPEQPTPLDTGSPLARAMFAAMGEAGITDRDDRLAYVSSVVGRDVTSSKEMSEDDARAVLDALEHRTEPEPAQ